MSPVQRGQAPRAEGTVSPPAGAAPRGSVPPSATVGICCHLPVAGSAPPAAPGPAWPGCPCVCPAPPVSPALQGGNHSQPAPGGTRTCTRAAQRSLPLETCPGSPDRLRETAGVTWPPCQGTHPTRTPIPPRHPSHQVIRPVRAPILPGHLDRNQRTPQCSWPKHPSDTSALSPC